MKALLRHMYRWAATAIAVCGLSLSCQKADDTPVEPEEPTTYEVQVEDFSTTRETMHIGGKLYLPEGRKEREERDEHHASVGRFVLVFPALCGSAQ